MMRKILGFSFAFLTLLLFLQILIGFPISLETEEEAPPRFGPHPQSPVSEQRMQGVHLVESRKGERDWELFAESAEGSQGKGNWQLTNVKILFYNGEKVDYTVTGQSGSIDSETKDMKVNGNVLTQSANGYRLQTDSIEYQAKKRLIKSPDKVRMSGPPDDQGKGILVEGNSMETMVEDNRMLIHDAVRAQKLLNSGRKFQIQSQKAEFSGKSKLVRFSERVSIEVDTMKMEGPEAEFQYMQEADILQSVLLRGGVRVSDSDKYATSDAVKFDPKENKYTLSGRPRIVQNSDEIMGDQIIFLDGGKRVKVENIKAKVEK